MTTTPRELCPPDHAHDANSTCYTAHRCACFECRDAARQRELRRRKDIAFGRYNRRVDAEPVRAYVRSLIAAGVTLRTIQRGTGTSLTTLMYGPGPQKRIDADRAAAILAYRPSLRDVASTTVIDARGTRRRLQGLVALGWTFADIARASGMASAVLSGLARASRCRAGTATQIAEVFEAMSMTLPGSRSRIERRDRTRARGIAAREGWVPPLAWDDIDDDDQPAIETMNAAVAA
ncbi:hypothetical protein [Microbacterium excoecariae]|uniref:hypothetical protein n=1 Tax=Microbacterium excoecariae TaxID=2715210 RepID=UPI001408D223|nr:hypothetical protein [Microbacterium excoecariae]NHI16834.1 hypothetical protein [Microbacterium excoecariae]